MNLRMNIQSRRFKRLKTGGDRGDRRRGAMQLQMALNSFNCSWGKNTLIRGRSLLPSCVLFSQLSLGLCAYNCHSRKLIRDIDRRGGTSGIKTGGANSLSCLCCLRADEDNRESERGR